MVHYSQQSTICPDRSQCALDSIFVHLNIYVYLYSGLPEAKMYVGSSCLVWRPCGLVRDGSGTLTTLAAAIMQ